MMCHVKTLRIQYPKAWYHVMNRGRGWRAHRIEEEVCKIFGVNRAELNETRRGLSNQAGNVATHLIRTLSGDTLDGICREFHIRRYRSSVGSGVQRMRATIKKGRNLRKCIETPRAQVHMSQEVTPFHSRRARR
jgi:chromosomal replication initiation ATPase DnaA